MQFTTPDMREITISDKSEACDFIKDSCKECNRKYECTGENAAFCNHMKNILVAKYGAAEGCLKESRIRHSMGVANFLFAYAKSHDWSKEETEDRSLNVDGMLPFENMVADLMYKKELLLIIVMAAVVYPTRKHLIRHRQSIKM